MDPEGGWWIFWSVWFNSLLCPVMMRLVLLFYITDGTFCSIHLFFVSIPSKKNSASCSFFEAWSIQLCCIFYIMFWRPQLSFGMHKTSLFLQLLFHLIPRLLLHSSTDILLQCVVFYHQSCQCYHGALKTMLSSDMLSLLYISWGSRSWYRFGLVVTACGYLILLIKCGS